MILLIDNYDSFTYNLVQLLREAGAQVEVIRNDDFPLDALVERLTTSEGDGRGGDDSVQGIVLSPGPGRPESAGVCLPLLSERLEVPVLGVCLGHQCLGQAWGATVERAPVLMHGKTSMVRYDDDPLFAGIDNPFQATRYHSLSVTEGTVPDVLQPLAWSDDGTLMAMRHKELPYWGVQFHPESVLTHAGVAMLRNFLQICGVAVTDRPSTPLINDVDSLQAAS